MDITELNIEELAEVLGYIKYEPDKADEYIREAIHFLKEYFGD